VKNPFPGAVPYGPEGRAWFFGREELSRAVAESVLGNRCVTVFGPAGAGKTSLLRASVVPALVESQDARVVHVAGWPASQDPTRRLADSLHKELRMGEMTLDLGQDNPLRAMLRRAVRASPRLLLICLDQLEQVLSPDWAAERTEAFLASLEEIIDLPLRSVRLVLSLREDHLGVLLQRLRGRLCLLEHHFRVVPLTVAELTEVACRAAASGEPPQTWPPGEIYPLLLQTSSQNTRPVQQAETHLAQAQSLCRALFERRAGGPGAQAR
jgi:hypothetical protein